MIDLTVYPNAKSTTPAARDRLSWDEFCGEIGALCSDESDATDKRLLPSLGLYALRDGAKRAAANVEKMSRAVALDIDGADVDALRARIKELGISAIVHGSPSDDEASSVRKLHAFVLADGPHAPADAGSVRRSVAALLGVAADASCSNADRVLFTGRLAGTSARYCERFYGDPIAIANLPAAPSAPATAPPAPATATPACNVAIDTVKYAVLGALGSATNWNGRKHALCGALGGLVRRSQSMAREDCAELVRSWLSTAGPECDIEAGVRWACKAYERLPDEVSGGRVFAAVVGDERASIVEQALLLPWRARRGESEPQLIETGDNDDLYIKIEENPSKRDWLIPELEMGVGRPYGNIGKTNASKTIVSMQRDIDLVLGAPVFGRFAGPGHPVRVLRIVYEGVEKIVEDFVRLLRGTGKSIDFADVSERLKVIDGTKHSLFLTRDSAANREWLLRVTEPFAGGRVTIDPLIAACRGLDENDTEIAEPIYEIEHVSRENGVAIEIVIHQGHNAQRARGSSAIEGAFGASATIERTGGNGQQNYRLISPRKLDRYGTEPFTVAIHDIDEQGEPWIPSKEKLLRGEYSWGLRVAAIDAPQPPHANPIAAKHAAMLQSKAQVIIEALRLQGEGGFQPALSITQARNLAAVRGDDWPEVMRLVQLAGAKLACGGAGRASLLSFPPRSSGV